MIQRTITIGLRARVARAFTILELVIVIAVIGLVAAIAVPSFSAMIESTNRSLAVNSVQAAVATARDLALRSSRGGDGGIVVVLREGGVVQLIPAVQVGSFNDYEALPDRNPNGPPTNSTGLANQVTRDVFVPVPQAEVVELPSGWMLAGFAPPGTMREPSAVGLIRNTWYDTPLYGGEDNEAPKEQGNWVMPEDWLYDVRVQALPPTNQTTGRQSFMIRFDARTGTISRSRRSVLFIDPRPSNDRPFQRRPPRDERVGDDNWKRVDQAVNIEQWALRALTDPDPNVDGRLYGSPPTPNRPLEAVAGEDTELLPRSELIGNRSNDTILCKPVDRLALFELSEMARGIGARGLNDRTGTLYEPFDRNAEDPIRIDRDLFRGAELEDIRVNMNRWIAGDTAGGSRTVGAAGERIGDGLFVFSEDDPEYRANPSNIDRPQALVFSISPYTGLVSEVR